MGGLPYELAHSVNGNLLVPASSASNIEQRLTDLQADLRKLGSDKAADRDRMDRAVKAMAELNNNFATFGGDITSNLHRLFANLKHANDTDASLLAENIRSLALDLELKLINVDMEAAKHEIKLLEARRR